MVCWHQLLDFFSSATTNPVKGNLLVAFRGGGNAANGTPLSEGTAWPGPGVMRPFATGRLPSSRRWSPACGSGRRCTTGTARMRPGRWAAGLQFTGLTLFLHKYVNFWIVVVIFLIHLLCEFQDFFSYQLASPPPFADIQPRSLSFFLLLLFVSHLGHHFTTFYALKS